MGYDAFISYSHTADADLAPALRDGLQRFAKPWNRRRALSVFLDQASLEVSAGLKNSLQDKLAEAEWLVLLLSEESAGSRWVSEEIGHWLADKPKERIALVQTSGDIVWDAAADDFDADASTAVPEGLRGVYSGQGSEPLWLDMRWAADPDEQLDLRNARFRDAIATLAAPIHGRPKDELEGEDIRQHRRLVRLRRAAITGLTLLTIAATIAGVVAVINARRARAEARTANARLLASQSREAFRPDQAVLVALEATRIESNVEARGALLDAVRGGAHVRYYLHDGPKPASAADVHPALGLVATGGRNGEFAVWDVGGSSGTPPPATRKVSETETGGLVAIGELVFHPTAPVLYTLGTDSDVKAWDVSDLSDVRQVGAAAIPDVADVVGSRNFVTAMAVDPGGRLLAVGGELASAFTLWGVADAGTPRLLSSQPMRTPATPSALAFDATGAMLAVGTATGFELWDVSEPLAPAFLATASGDAPRGSTTALAFVPLMPALAWGGAGGGIQVWDLSTPTDPVVVSPETGDGLTSLAFTTEANRVLIGTSDGQVVTWDISAAGGPTPVAFLAGHGGEVLTAEVLGSGGAIVSVEEEGAVIVWDSAGLGGPGSLGTALPGMPRDVSFEPAGDRFWTVTDRGRVSGWEVGASGPVLAAELGADGPVGEYGVAAAGGVVAVATDVALGGSGDPGTVVVWDAETGSRRWVESVAGATGEAVALTDDGGLLAVGTARPGATLLWDLTVAGGEPVPLRLPDAETIVAALAFQSAEGFLVEGGGGLAGGSLRLWDVSDRVDASVVYEDFEVPSVVFDVAFSPAGNQLVAGLEDGSLMWWDVVRDTAQREGGPVNAHAGPVWAVAFSPDGSTVISAGDDGRIVVWDADSRTRIAEFADFTQPVTGLAFQPAGANLISTASAAPNGFVAWELDAAEWRRIGCAFTNRNMTPEEWARYAGADEPYVEHCGVS